MHFETGMWLNVMVNQKFVIILSLHIFLFYYVWAFGRCSASRILGEKQMHGNFCRDTYFFFQQRKKLCLFWRLVLLNIKGSSERQSTSYAWESRGKGQGGTPKTCQSPGWPENTCRPPAPYVNKERLGPQCYSRPSPKYWEKEKGELKATAQHFISGFVSCTNILFNHYFGSIK